jgi:hypothetical protein
VVSGRLNVQAALPPERAPGIHYIGGLGETRAGVDDAEKMKFLILAGLELRPLGLQPVASRYTDCAIPAPNKLGKDMFTP